MMPWTSFKYTLSQAENYVGSFSCTAKELVSQVTGQGHTVSIVWGRKEASRREDVTAFYVLPQKGFALGY